MPLVPTTHSHTHTYLRKFPGTLFCLLLFLTRFLRFHLLLQVPHKLQTPGFLGVHVCLVGARIRPHHTQLIHAPVVRRRTRR